MGFWSGPCSRDHLDGDKGWEGLGVCAGLQGAGRQVAKRLGHVGSAVRRPGTPVLTMHLLPSPKSHPFLF